MCEVLPDRVEAEFCANILDGCLHWVESKLQLENIHANILESIAPSLYVSLHTWCIHFEETSDTQNMIFAYLPSISELYAISRQYGCICLLLVEQPTWLSIKDDALSENSTTICAVCNCGTYRYLHRLQELRQITDGML